MYDVTKQEDRESLADKIEWEGGLLEAFGNYFGSDAVEGDELLIDAIRAFQVAVTILEREAERVGLI